MQVQTHVDIIKDWSESSVYFYYSGLYSKSITLHNEAKSPSRVHFWDLLVFMILNLFLGYFMLGDPKTTPKVMLIIIYYPFPNVKFENG